jgi:hypothetical protein
MDTEKKIPFTCNFFGIATNNGQTFIFDFLFQEPPQKPGEENKTYPITRIALDRIGAERLLIILQQTLNNTKKDKSLHDLQ